ncbi:MAG: (2Fe-2S)-binding protein, partial [Atribacteria sp.]|nr:(2Fe-2S)-binding protein [Candidatus Atribacteria bacterium]
AVKSCIVLALQANHKEVWTVKGMEKLELGRKLQESFVNHGAIQCGFCTAGMILTAKDYMDKNPIPDKNEIKKAISGNLCRCTGYKKIVDAIYDVAAENYKLEGEIYV